MTEHAGSSANVNACEEKRGRGGMPEIVQARRGYSGLARDAIEGARRCHWGHAATELVGEDCAVVVNVKTAACEPFAGL
jgi:hypothetical protein